MSRAAERRAGRPGRRRAGRSNIPARAESDDVSVSGFRVGLKYAMPQITALIANHNDYITRRPKEGVGALLCSGMRLGDKEVSVVLPTPKLQWAAVGDDASDGDTQSGLTTDSNWSHAFKEG